MNIELTTGKEEGGFKKSINVFHALTFLITQVTFIVIALISYNVRMTEIDIRLLALEKVTERNVGIIKENRENQDVKYEKIIDKLNQIQIDMKDKENRHNN